VWVDQYKYGELLYGESEFWHGVEGEGDGGCTSIDCGGVNGGHGGGGGCGVDTRWKSNVSIYALVPGADFKINNCSVAVASGGILRVGKLN
jgi:hypothetical protein